MPFPAAQPHYSTVPGLFPLEGGCVCGLVRYRVTAAPLVVHCCHCQSCQRENGTAFALNAVVESSFVERLPPLETPINPVACPTTILFEGEGDKEVAAKDNAEKAEEVTKTSGEAKGPPSLAPAMPAHPPAASAAAAADGKDTGIWEVTMPSLSGHGHPITRCARCGTAVWSYYGGGPLITFICVGTLDHSWAVDPDVHIFTQSKRAFVTLPSPPGTFDKETGVGVPVYDEFYPGKEAFWRPESIARYEAVLPDIKKWYEAFMKAKEKEKEAAAKEAAAKEAAAKESA